MNMTTFCPSAATMTSVDLFNLSNFPITRYCSKCGIILARWETYHEDGFIITGWHYTPAAVNSFDSILCSICCSEKLK